jgi:hypothetical protein
MAFWQDGGGEGVNDESRVTGMLRRALGSHHGEEQRME